MPNNTHEAFMNVAAPTLSENVDHLGLLESVLSVEDAATTIEVQMEVADTKLFLDALSLESTDLGEEAQKWKALAQQALDDRMQDSFEASDKKSLWRRMVDAIRAFFKRVRDAFHAFFSKLITGAPILEKKAEKIKKNASKLSGEPKTRDFDSEFAGKLGKGGKPPTERGLVKDIEYISVLSKEITDNVKEAHKVADDYLKTLSEITKALPKIDKNPIAAQVAVLRKAHSYKSMTQDGRVFGIDTPSLVDAKSSDDLPGGVAVGYSVPTATHMRGYLSTQSSIVGLKDRGRYGDVMSSFRAHKMLKLNHDRDRVGNVPTLRKDAIVSICDTTIDTVKVYVAHGKQSSDTTRRIDSIAKATDELANALEKHGSELDASQKAVVKDTMDFSKALSAVMVQMALAVDNIALKVVTQTLAYCEASIAKH